jgi:hypothetical protein
MPPASAYGCLLTPTARCTLPEIGVCPEVICITSAAFQAGSNVFQDRSTAAGLETCFGLFSSGDFLGGFDRLGPAFPV